MTPTTPWFLASPSCSMPWLQVTSHLTLTPLSWRPSASLPEHQAVPFIVCKIRKRENQISLVHQLQNDEANPLLLLYFTLWSCFRKIFILSDCSSILKTGRMAWQGWDVWNLEYANLEDIRMQDLFLTVLFWELFLAFAGFGGQAGVGEAHPACAALIFHFSAVGH